jgi:hypothetical protein
MRRWLFLLLIVLLPLRGWVGEAMAGQMLQQATAGAHAHAMAQASQHAHAPAMHGDTAAPHAMAAGCCDDDSAHAPAQAAPSHAGGDCGTCASCQVCSAVALAPPQAAVAPAGFTHPPPPAPERRYASAERALAFKPPRS